MDIYLPIAEVSVNWPLLVLLGAGVGFVSGLFGIGGGFLMAPILIFLGIPPAVAVASQASHVVASSTSGVIRYSGQGAVDFRMGGIMAFGGALGAFLGGVLLLCLGMALADSRLVSQSNASDAFGSMLYAGAAIQLAMSATMNGSLALVITRSQACRSLAVTAVDCPLVAPATTETAWGAAPRSTQTC